MYITYSRCNELLQEVFGGIRSAQIFRAALWILGEYCDTKESVTGVMEIIKKSLGELPIVESELRAAAGEEENEEFKEKDATVDAKTKVSAVMILGSRKKGNDSTRRFRRGG